MHVPKRLLALDVRISKLGFAVFEGPTSLLDWGVRSFEKSGKELSPSLSERLRVLFAFYEPAAIVARSRNYHLRSHKRTQAKIMAIIKSESRRHSTRFTIVTVRQVRSAFAKNAEIYKHDIALLVTNQFEELAWKLPQRRKSYQSELTAMLVFDAAANGMAYFRRQARPQSATQPGS